MNCSFDRSHIKMLLKYTIISLVFIFGTESGILYPGMSKTRDVFSLDGIWSFVLPNSSNISDKMYLDDFATVKGVQPMAVPSSYNDLGTDSIQRDYIGVAWYQRKFFVPKFWNTQKVWIRFSSVCYAAKVWINSHLIISHTIGHLPFQEEITLVLNFGNRNVITVAVENVLTNSTVPQGRSFFTSGKYTQNYTFQYFNYGGINGPVTLFTTPLTFIDDVTVLTDVKGTTGYISYSVSIEGGEVAPKVVLLNEKDKNVASGHTLEGILVVPNASLWWPHLMHPKPGYLYSFRIQLFDKSRSIIDEYKLPVGIRTISWDNKILKINHKDVYLRGFGYHQDAEIRGSRLDFVTAVRDYNLVKWIGANSFKTTNFPMSEEVMDLADQMGIMVIAEFPSINTEHYNEKLLKNHKRAITEIIQRDKNRPSVIMWSIIAGTLVTYIKSLDKNRPLTIVMDQKTQADSSGQFADVITCNINKGWSSNIGNLDVIAGEVTSIAKYWYKKFKKPIIVTGYGAETLESLHLLPAYAWSEEYQIELISKYFQAFDKLKSKGFLVGEIIATFADFQSDQNFRKAGYMRGGVFTRNRQPKSGAHLLRQRFWAMAQDFGNVTLPQDLQVYVYKEGLSDNEI